MSFFKKIFGLGKSKAPQELEALITEVLGGVFERAGLDLEISIKDFQDDNLVIELGGNDEELLTDKDGQLLDGIQFFMKRALQHRLPDSKVEIQIDTNGFRESADKELRDEVDRLIVDVIDKGKAVYFRALPPKHRKVIHQHLANNTKVKSRSIGDGLYKKIKIFPAGQERRPRNGGGNRQSNQQA